MILFSCCSSDVHERDLVELILEVAVAQVSRRQKDMLIRQVGVLLGVLDSDITVREISAFNEHRSVQLNASSGLIDSAKLNAHLNRSDYILLMQTFI